MWSIIIFLIIFLLPGLLMAKSDELQLQKRNFCKFLMISSVLLLFPALLFIVKIINIFGLGKQWQSLATSLETCEGIGESCLQLLLNLYIILTSDRLISTTQWITIATSYGALSMRKPALYDLQRVLIALQCAMHIIFKLVTIANCCLALGSSASLLRATWEGF